MSYPTFRYYYSGGTGQSDQVNDGQLLIGSSDGIPRIANIQGGPGITVTNGPGTISVAADDHNVILAGSGISVTNSPGEILIAANPQIEEVSEVLDVVTSSLSDVLLGGMTSTPGAGNYLVFFSGEAEHDDDAGVITVSVYVGGVLVGSSISQVSLKPKNSSKCISTMAYLNGVADGQAIDITWRVNLGEGLFHRRRLIVQKIG